MHPLPEVGDQSEVGRRRTHNIIIWPCQLMEAYKFGKGVTGTVQNSPIVRLNKKYDKNMYKSLFFVHAVCYYYDTIVGLDATVVFTMGALLMLYGT